MKSLGLLVVAVALALVAACAASSRPAALAASPAPAASTPAATDGDEVWPPRIAWPDRTAFRVDTQVDTVGPDGKRTTDRHYYLLAYEADRDGGAHFWEAGADPAQTDPFHLAIAEAGVYPALHIAPSLVETEHRGHDEFVAALLATRALAAKTETAEAVRTGISHPEQRVYTEEETTTEWWFIVGAWVVPLRAMADVADRTSTAGGTVTDQRVDVTMGSDEPGHWKFRAVITPEGTDAVRLHGTWTGRVADIPFGFHFFVLSDQLADPATASATLVVDTVSERATLLPRRMTSSWEVRFTDETGVERVASQTEDQTYTSVPWSALQWRRLGD